MAGIAFTYDPMTPVGLVRLLTADTDAASLNRTGGERTRTDSEIQALLEQTGGDVRLAAATLLESRAAEYARSAIHTQQGQLVMDYTQRSNACLQAAGAIRSCRESPAVCASAEPAFTQSNDPAKPGSMDSW